MFAITKNRFNAPKARKVTSTGPLSPETALERAAQKLYDKKHPQVGVTLEDVLTLPEEEQYKLGFQVEKLRLPVEQRGHDEPILNVPETDHDKIIVMTNAESNFQMFFKKGTNPFTTVGYPLERAAYESRGLDPDSGPPLTYGDAIDTPKDFLAEHQTALTRVTEPVWVNSTCDFLVPPLKMQETQIAAYIYGYLEAMCAGGGFKVEGLAGGGSLKCMTWHWAHEFLQDRHASVPAFIRHKIAENDGTRYR